LQPEVNAAFGEQDNHFITADVLTAKPTRDGEASACELKVTEPNPPDGHRHGVGALSTCLVKVLGESAERPQTVSVDPIHDDLLPFRYRQAADQRSVARDLRQLTPAACGNARPFA
jgi:hypothetical protein